MDNNPSCVAELLLETSGDVLFDVFCENYIKPSEDWLFENYSNKKQYDHYKSKRKQSLEYDQNALISHGRKIHKRLSREGLLTKEGKEAAEEECFIDHFIFSVGFVKGAMQLENSLKNNVYFPESIQKRLGFSFDFYELKKWKKRHIRWQAAAQILWFENREASVETIKNQLLRDPQLFELLELEALPSTGTPPDKLNGTEPFFRSLGDVISIVRPRDDRYFTHIPAVYNEANNKLHGQALYIALHTMTEVLKKRGWSSRDIMFHDVLCAYALSESLNPVIFSLLVSFVEH